MRVRKVFVVFVIGPSLDDSAEELNVATVVFLIPDNEVHIVDQIIVPLEIGVQVHAIGKGIRLLPSELV